MLVNATSSGELTGPPGRFGSALSSCQAQNPPPGRLKPSGLVPVGDRITYWAWRLEAAVVLPKCEAAAMASVPSCRPVATPGDAARSSTQTPASAPPAGYPTWNEFAGQTWALYFTPSQYCVIT